MYEQIQTIKKYSLLAQFLKYEMYGNFIWKKNKIVKNYIKIVCSILSKIYTHCQIFAFENRNDNGEITLITIKINNYNIDGFNKELFSNIVNYFSSLAENDFKFHLEIIKDNSSIVVCNYIANNGTFYPQHEGKVNHEQLKYLTNLIYSIENEK